MGTNFTIDVDRNGILPGVVSKFLSLLAGLFAAGGTAAGLSGRGGEGYLPGNGLAQSFGLAWLAVEALTR